MNNIPIWSIMGYVLAAYALSMVRKLRDDFEKYQMKNASSEEQVRLRNEKIERLRVQNRNLMIYGAIGILAIIVFMIWYG